MSKDKLNDICTIVCIARAAKRPTLYRSKYVSACLVLFFLVGGGVQLFSFWLTCQQVLRAFAKVAKDQPALWLELSQAVSFCSLRTKCLAVPIDSVDCRPEAFAAGPMDWICEAGRQRLLA